MVAYNELRLSGGAEQAKRSGAPSAQSAG